MIHDCAYHSLFIVRSRRTCNFYKRHGICTKETENLKLLKDQKKKEERVHLLRVKVSACDNTCYLLSDKIPVLLHLKFGEYKTKA